jgi:hypothetical protein
MRAPLFAARFAVIIFVQTAALFRIYSVINTAERPYFRLLMFAPEHASST